MITRAVALLDRIASGVATTCGAGTAYDLGAVEADQTALAALHVLSCGSGTNAITFKIFSSSSSGFGAGNTGTQRFAFTAWSCRVSEWGTPVTGAFATCQRFWRGEWATSCTGRKALVVFSRTCLPGA